jgi:hypothetical protein
MKNRDVQSHVLRHPLPPAEASAVAVPPTLLA